MYTIDPWFPTSDHQGGGHTDHSHLILGHAGVVARMLAAQLTDGQQAGHIVNPHDHALVQLLAVPEPGHQHGRVSLRHEAGLSQALASFKIIPEHKVLNFWCN